MAEAAKKRGGTDLGTPLGILLGLGLIVGSILVGSSLLAYADLPSALIVVGGTFASTLVAESLPNVVNAMKVAANAMKVPAGDAVDTVDRIVELSTIARREGLLALENHTVDDEFLQKGLRMAVDGLPQAEIHETLTAELVAMRTRHQRGHKLFKFMSATAPAMGMIGTLVGLVQMLQNLEDPSAIGPAMAVALLTTLYGAILAFLLFGPIAEKLERRTAEETAHMQVVIDGIDAIVRGQNAAVIRERLHARLSPKQRKKNGSAPT